ncbi:NAD(P)-dependent oxidoreductase [Marmoricola sp. Leaf446]|uniref:NAD(P)H-dependent oxidoreductase n=1 Tax=Marmoricola sp. Leaf446 TaxID=1736379 RepID=UPI0006FD3D26|nr:SAF domain-containing protein [Marmoricola sp. Leaf446]KQT92265.1 NAD(P)-dependent oxidoreductase [Marmoricola sp. Leaf446]
MILVDTALRQRAAEGNPVRVALVGAGFMGRGLTNQIVNSVPGMQLVAIANRTLGRAEQAYSEAGVDDYRTVSSAAELDAAVADGVAAVTSDHTVVCDAASVDAIVEATGAVEFGCHVVVRALAGGKHVVLMNAEVDATVGPVLSRRAAEAGVVLTGCDGDQPGVQMNLVRFVRGIGLTPLVCGNVKGLQDPYRTPTTQQAFAERWGQDPHMVTSFADGTKISIEQATVANATGMTVARRGMGGADHAGHVDELVEQYDVEELRAAGGVVDYVVGSKPGPGVFVLATHDDPKQRHYLELYKLGTGPLYSFYTPYHLCHFEVPTTVARAVLFGDATIAPLGAPTVEVVAVAKRALPAGTVLDGLGGYDTYGEAEKASVTTDQGLLPIGVAEGCRLTRDVAQDEVLTYADVVLPEGRLVDQLRDEQARLFAD